MSCLQLSEDRFPLIVLYILQNNTKCRNGNFFDFFRIPPFKELFFPLLRLQQLVPTSHPPSCLVNIETSRRKLCSGVQSVDKIGSEINHAWPKQKAFAHLFFLQFSPHVPCSLGGGRYNGIVLLFLLLDVVYGFWTHLVQTQNLITPSTQRIRRVRLETLIFTCDSC